MTEIIAGELCPDKVYTKEGLRRAAGIGPSLLRKARASGIVRPLNKGNRTYYLGREVISWITEDLKCTHQN